MNGTSGIVAKTSGASEADAKAIAPPWLPPVVTIFVVSTFGKCLAARTNATASE